MTGLFPDSAHVFDLGFLQFTSDLAIWEYARTADFIIVTADADFLDLARIHGPPPKVVWLENCNYKTSRVEKLLRRHAVRIAQMESSARGVVTIRNTA